MQLFADVKKKYLGLCVNHFLLRYAASSSVFWNVLSVLHSCSTECKHHCSLPTLNTKGEHYDYVDRFLWRSYCWQPLAYLAIDSALLDWLIDCWNIMLESAELTALYYTRLGIILWYSVATRCWTADIRGNVSWTQVHCPMKIRDIFVRCLKQKSYIRVSEKS